MNDAKSLQNASSDVLTSPLPAKQTEIEGAEVLETSTPVQVLENTVASNSTVTPLSRSDTPSGQLPAVDPELFERARAAVSALRGHGRRANGRAGAGNTLALRTGLRSEQLIEQPDIRAWHREETDAITADLGGPDELGTLKRRVTREAARVLLILDALGDGLLEGGPLTGKGKCRAATMVYLQVLDRYLKLVALLGLERQTKNALPSTLSEAARAMSVGGGASVAAPGDRS